MIKVPDGYVFGELCTGEDAETKYPADTYVTWGKCVDVKALGDVILRSNELIVVLFRWRPVTMRDLERVLNGETVQARTTYKTGRLVGWRQPFEEDQIDESGRACLNGGWMLEQAGSPTFYSDLEVLGV